jgi:hypothetical protein
MLETQPKPIKLLYLEEKPKDYCLTMPLFLQKKLAKSLKKQFMWDKENLEERMNRAQKFRDEKINDIKAKGKVHE